MESLRSYYSHASYRNGFSNEDEDAPKRLYFETGFYYLELDVNDLTKMWYRLKEEEEEANDDCYEDAFSTPCLHDLEELPLVLQIKDGTTTTFTCHSTTPGPSPQVRPFNKSVILWDAGRISQRFELMKLRDQDNTCSVDDKSSWSLDLQVWPDAFCFTLKGQGVKQESLDITLLIGKDDKWTQEQCVVPDEKGNVSCSLQCTIAEHRPTTPNLVQVTTNETVVPTTYDPVVHGYQATALYDYTANKEYTTKLVREFADGYVPIRDYDEYEITVNNDDDDDDVKVVPFVLYMGLPANSTGMCPMILTQDESGKWAPSGIPVQISKNWDMQLNQPYVTIYAMLPSSITCLSSYLLRVAYGFYGTLPCASHAQLGLQGYHESTGRWCQLAIGCWGETFCIDPELTCGDIGHITDVRGLMLGSKKENHWNWTHCAWGGDWMRVRRQDNEQRLYPNNVKVAYLAHGPCLTCTQYHGYHGDQQVEFTITLRTLRTDDYCRNFVSFDYKVLEGTVKIDYLHNMLNRSFHTPTVAHGNGTGLIQEREVPNGLAHDEVFVENQVVDGTAPFWFTFPDSEQFPTPDKAQMPSGFKSLIVQSFSASVGDACYTNPAFSLVNESWDGQPSLYVNLEVPDGINTLSKGDSIQMETECTTNAREQADYYGPNSIYSWFLAENPKSYKIPFREVQWNGSILDIQVKEGGTLIHKYPLKINVDQECKVVRMDIKAGVGGFPMEFCLLPDTNYRLYQTLKNDNGEEEDILMDQSTHADGNDYWQADYDFTTKTYTMTFTPMLGPEFATAWTLKKHAA